MWGCWVQSKLQKENMFVQDFFLCVCGGCVAFMSSLEAPTNDAWDGQSQGNKPVRAFCYL